MNDKFQGYNPTDLQRTLNYIMRDIDRHKKGKKKIPDSLRAMESLLRRELSRRNLS